MKSKPDVAYFGILVSAANDGGLPVRGRAFYRRLSRIGKRHGLTVCVFAPEWIDWTRRRTLAYVRDDARGGWTRRTVPLPNVVYDRAFFNNDRNRYLRHRAAVARLRRTPGVALLGLGLTGKLEVYRMLSKDEAIRPWLPPTVRLDGPDTLRRWLLERGDVVVKPNAGTHGKRVCRLRALEDGTYEASGRDGANRPVARRFRALEELLRWVRRELVGHRAFLIQPYLTLAAPGGAPFDVRALVQKDGEGAWRLTGAAARIGPADGLTSNLHGGGTSREADAWVASLYGEAQAKDIMSTIARAALAVPPALERRHGPLLELGIDFGVDRDGRVWVLEVNSKPGRTSFTRLKDNNARFAAVTSPIRYARYVLDRQLGGQINEFDVKQDPFYAKNG